MLQKWRRWVSQHEYTNPLLNRVIERSWRESRTRSTRESCGEREKRRKRGRGKEMARRCYVFWVRDKFIACKMGGQHSWDNGVVTISIAVIRIHDYFTRQGVNYVSGEIADEVTARQLPSSNFYKYRRHRGIARIMKCLLSFPLQSRPLFRSVEVFHYENDVTENRIDWYINCYIIVGIKSIIIEWKSCSISERGVTGI